MRRRRAISQQPGQRRRRGSSVLEFALAWSVLWLLFSGIWQFGYAFYVYNRLQTSTSNAAILAARLTYDTGNPSAFTNTIKNLVVYGRTTTGTKPLVPGLSTGNVNVSVNPQGGMPTDVTITIQNYSIDTIFKIYALTNKPRVTTLYMGQIVCTTC
jgi:Flp pilus assembly protein TadG